MSKIGKKPILIPDGVKVELRDSALEVNGKEGVLTLSVLPYTRIKIQDKEIRVESLGQDKQARANWGTMRSLASNAVLGVNAGFLKELEIQGVGFRASLEGDNLVLNLGFSHPVKFPIPAGVKVLVEKNIIKISGPDKNLVGQVAANIRILKKPEPYKGKGIRYRGEAVRQKAGKKVAGATAAA